jgi:transcriptional regulator with XRE-family HTH domain
MGKMIRKWRADNGWSQSKLADKAGVKQAYISQIENGKKIVKNIDMLRRFSKITGLTVDELSPE